MALREILLFGDEALRKKCRPVTKFDERLWELLDDLTETLMASDGVGLAAPQVGILRRVAVVNTRDDSGTIELINPEIIKEEGHQTGNEGCLSAPNEYSEVERPYEVTVKAFDRHGNEFTVKGRELRARAFCHEIDHLDGILFIDHVKKTLPPRKGA